MYEFRIKVTAEHLSRGVRKWKTRCPIALAAADQLGCKVYVSHGYIAVYPNDSADCLIQLLADQYTIKKILEYDKGVPVAPFVARYMLARYMQK